MARFAPGGCDCSWRKWLLVLAAPWLILMAISQLAFQHHIAAQQNRPLQQTRASHPPADFFLVAVIFNRVFAADLFNITAFECSQWIEYMMNAGVDHIYWYDTAHDQSESQEDHLRRYVQSGVLTYHRFYSLFPAIEGSDFHYEQDNSYAHFLAHYNQSSSWVVEMDVDEYPFSPKDLAPGFLAQFVRRVARDSPGVSQILLQCMLFLGNPMGDPGKWVIERYQRRKRESEGRAAGFHSRQKPIFKPAIAQGVTSFDPHKFLMASGDTIVAAAEEMRMNHYWGARATGFGPDTPALVESLVADSSIQPIATDIKTRDLDLIDALRRSRLAQSDARRRHRLKPSKEWK